MHGDPGGADLVELAGAATAHTVKRAVFRHDHILITAPPGIGPTALARRLGGLLPPLTRHQRRWLRAEYDGAGLRRPGEADPMQRPFRAPHHTVSAAALVGARGRAGEVHLARFGLLVLDELCAFRPDTIRALAATLATMAGAPLVVASTLPCPCGWRGSDRHPCRCSDLRIARYRARIERCADRLRLRCRVTLPSLSLAQLRRAKYAS